MSTAYDFPLRADVCPASRFLRGAQLAAHVTRGLAGTQSASRVAATAGYHVDRCADRLAECGNAPLGRALLDRDHADRTRPYVVLSVERTRPKPKPKPTKTNASTWIDSHFQPRPAEPKRTRRPAASADEILWELEDAACRGVTFDAVAATYGIAAASLRRRIERFRIVAAAREHFPRLGYRTAGRPPVATTPTGHTCRMGHPLYATTDGCKARCRECNRRHKALRRARMAEGAA